MKSNNLGTFEMVLIGTVCLVGLIMELSLLNMWNADKSYALGKNLDSVSQYIQGYQYLKDAVTANPDEPTFRDELAFSQAVIASAIATSSAEKSQELIREAIANSDYAVTTSPDSLPFWKNRTKLFYQLASIDSKYYVQALDAIQKAATLAPTDAKVHYNLGLLLGQNGQISPAIKALEETVQMKPDYRDAHHTLGLLYDQTGDKTKAKGQMEFIINRIGPDKEAEKWLKENP